MTLQFREEHLPSYHRQIAIKLQTATAAAAKWASVKGCEGIQNMIFELEQIHIIGQRVVAINIASEYIVVSPSFLTNIINNLIASNKCNSAT